jgi:hypothetical protein
MAQSTIGSSILSTGMPTIGRAAAAQGEMDEQVNCTTSAPAASAAMTC